MNGRVCVVTGASSGIGRATALTRLLKPFFRTPEQGAATSLHVATSLALEGVTGKYFLNCREARSSRTSYDRALARRLWDESARLTGLGEVLPHAV